MKASEVWKSWNWFHTSLFPKKEFKAHSMFEFTYGSFFVTHVRKGCKKVVKCYRVSSSKATGCPAESLVYIFMCLAHGRKRYGNIIRPPLGNQRFNICEIVPVIGFSTASVYLKEFEFKKQTFIIPFCNETMNFLNYVV